MKFLFLGLGSIGSRHLRNLCALGYRDFFAYRTQASRNAAETECGVRRVVSYEAGLALHPDAVFVTNPTALHVRTAMAALSAGCHVFIEKPVAASREGVGELVRRAAETGRVVAVGYQMRFHPILVEIKRIVASGELGRPLFAHLEIAQHLADWHPGEDPRSGYAARRDLGGGAILTLSHELDSALWLFGPACAVTCRGGTTSNLVVDVEDTATLLVEFAAGAVATIHIDYLQRPPSRSLKIVCERGKIEWDYFSDRAVVWRESGSEHPIPLPSGFERNSLYRDEVEHFIRAIRGEEQNRIPLASAVAALDLSLAALASLEGGSSVPLVTPESSKP